MSKVLLILSMVVMIVAIVFAYQNGRTMADERDKKASLHRTIKLERGTLDTLKAEIIKTAGEVVTVQGDVAAEGERLKQHNTKIAQIDSESKITQEKFDEQNKKHEAQKAELAQLPQGINLATLTEDLNKMKSNIAELKDQAAAKKKEVEAEQVKVAAAASQKADLVRKIEERKKAFERNALTARIVAVNNDWGFVVIDAGKSTGITQDTKLLITRGTQTVGKLSIMSVEGNRTVANVLSDTLAPGMAPVPGDRVILENLVQ